jgi:hypothetical protein
MKKNNELPAKTNSKKDDTHNISKEKKSKTSDKEKDEVLGTMKIGKAHFMEDDKVSIKIKER